MATLLDEPQETEEQRKQFADPKELDPDNDDISNVAESQQDQNDNADDDDDDIPEKYRGKSMKEIIRMHQEAEKRMGRQGGEVGELRKIVDSYIQEQSQKATQRETPKDDEVDDTDFFSDPKGAINKSIESHPALKEAERTTAEYRKQMALSQIKQEYPDLEEIVGDEGFAQWIAASPTRKRLFVEADMEYNVDSARELFDTWKERKQLSSKTAESDSKARKQQLKDASTGASRGSDAGKSKKIYRRADIIKLMTTDPERYADMSDDILKAYAEGRVR